MKIKFVLWMSVSILVIFTACNTGTKTPGSETGEEVAEALGVLSGTGVGVIMEEEWISLFDGETSKGWRGYKKDHFPSGWEVIDGTLHCIGSGRGEAGNKEGGDIIYDKIFKNFSLKLEWKISEGGNSGIFYLGEEELDYIWKTAPEMQVLDNEKHPDAQLGKDGNRQAGSLYDLIPAVPQNARPAGEWNEVEIMVFKGTVVHKMNGETVLEYHLWTPEWNELVAGSKFPALNPDWAEVASKGYIGLQDHGDDVWYRNIEIKEL
ncbi:MAG: DUF1080 domain-containing protein [Bacteroidota bacterium]|nr:DUF1080 domain-containing protein [Bacteroidota bacterium]